MQQVITDNLDLLLEVLPPPIRSRLEGLEQLQGLLEIVMDLGREPEARFPGRAVYLDLSPISEQDIDYVVDRVGDFGEDNRAGIPATLHRISAIRNRRGGVVGLTLRVGRSVYGTVDIIRDTVETGKSILLLGRPGIGKTTKLREVARVISDELRKRVVIVDTSNEIAGDGDIPHPGIGHARRMQVRRPELQHAVMIEAVENHMPECVVIDEIGTEQEAAAARTIAERGVQLIATAHGNTLENVLMNPTLSDLVGGMQAVTLSDEEARRRGTQKTVLERKAPPTFDIVVEISEIDRLGVHHNVAEVVDRLLRGHPPVPELRVRKADGQVEIQAAQVPTQALMEEALEDLERPRRVPSLYRGYLPREVLRIFPYGVSHGKVERALRDLDLPAEITHQWEEADAVIALKAYERKEPHRLRAARDQGRLVLVIRSNTFQQVAGALQEVFRLRQAAQVDQALQEAQKAAEEVLATSRPIELSPQVAPTRRLQHRLAQKYHLHSESVGDEPGRRVRIFK